MARINIDDELRGDPRFNALCAITSRQLAFGAVLCLWEIGQSYWKRNQSLIPEHLAEQLPNITELMRVGLAIHRTDGVYCSGAQERWNFLLSRVIAGKNSAQARKKKYGTAVPFNARNALNLRTNAEQTSEHGPNKTEPSSSSSSSTEEEYISLEIPKETPAYLEPEHLPAPDGARDTLKLVKGEETLDEGNTPLSDKPKGTRTRRREGGSSAALRQEFERIYELFPRKEGKKRGIDRLVKQQLDKQQLADFEKAVKNYAQRRDGEDPQFTKHFSTFVGEWEDYVDLPSLTPHTDAILAEQNAILAKYLAQKKAAQNGA